MLVGLLNHKMCDKTTTFIIKSIEINIWSTCHKNMKSGTFALIKNVKISNAKPNSSPHIIELLLYYFHSLLTPHQCFLFRWNLAFCLLKKGAFDPLRFWAIRLGWNRRQSIAFDMTRTVLLKPWWLIITSFVK